MRGMLRALALLTVAVVAGCVSDRVIEDTRKPELEITPYGVVLVNGVKTERGRIVKAMRRAGFAYDQEVNIHIPDRPDRELMKSLTGELVQGGYKRHVFVKSKRATSALPPKPQPAARETQPARTRQPTRGTRQPVSRTPARRSSSR
ncbi:MAG: hypothetical protein J6334_03565 [Kiritimatiellae bacterium]|nr:hypothetical protein [Kiritimatiellia bacterium]